MTDLGTDVVLAGQAHGSSNLVPTSDHPGATALIDSACKVINQAYDVAVRDIEDAITRLENLKISVELKKLAAQESLKDFMNSVGHGVNVIKDLQQIIGSVEEKHLQ